MRAAASKELLNNLDISAPTHRTDLDAMKAARVAVLAAALLALASTASAQTIAEVAVLKTPLPAGVSYSPEVSLLLVLQWAFLRLVLI